MRAAVSHPPTDPSDKSKTQKLSKKKTACKVKAAPQTKKRSTATPPDPYPPH